MGVSFVHLKDFIKVKLKIYGQSMRHYHADGGNELISKAVINLLKSIVSTFTWSPTGTPKLNGVSKRKFKTVGERLHCPLISGWRCTRQVIISRIDCPRRLFMDILHSLKRLLKTALIYYILEYGV